jgi:ABC-type Zn uptake system ZnuABC Zn-binding protein ZnuA
MKAVHPLVCVSVLVICACAPSTGSADKRLSVLTTVSPITDIARHVAGDAAVVTGVIPEGVDSHTFEPTPETARVISRGDVLFVNGLHLEDPTRSMAESGLPDDAVIFALGDHAIESSAYIYDFSFPRSDGRPNPHLWMDVPLAIEYAQLIEEQLARADPANASTYESNAGAYVAELSQLDSVIRKSVATIPPENRVLLTYHDSFAYFAADYGFRVIGAIQPSDFTEPSAQEVASLIDQIERERVPAIFGSEVFPSPVLAQIARETGVSFEDSLRDDVLPEDPGSGHSYVGLMIYDVSTIVDALGGDSTAIAGFLTD